MSMNPDLYSDYGFRSTKLLITGPIWIRIHSTDWLQRTVPIPSTCIRIRLLNTELNPVGRRKNGSGSETLSGSFSVFRFSLVHVNVIVILSSAWLSCSVRFCNWIPWIFTARAASSWKFAPPLGSRLWSEPGGSHRGGLSRRCQHQEAPGDLCLCPASTQSISGSTGWYTSIAEPFRIYLPDPTLDFLQEI